MARVDDRKKLGVGRFAYPRLITIDPVRVPLSINGTILLSTMHVLPRGVSSRFFRLDVLGRSSIRRATTWTIFEFKVLPPLVPVHLRIHTCIYIGTRSSHILLSSRKRKERSSEFLCERVSREFLSHDKNFADKWFDGIKKFRVSPEWNCCARPSNTPPRKVNK